MAVAREMSEGPFGCVAVGDVAGCTPECASAAFPLPRRCSVRALPRLLTGTDEPSRPCAAAGRPRISRVLVGVQAGVPARLLRRRLLQPQRERHALLDV